MSPTTDSDLGPRPLEGIRVLDATGLLSGPYATMVLGDLGAEIIKIEHPERPDETRKSPPFFGGESHYFLSINRNKRSLAVDLKTESGRALIAELAESCDILMENFRPGVAHRLGLGFEDIRSLNPGIVYCSISGFGQAGPMAQRPAYDLIALAASGIMSTTGEPDRAPVKLGLPLSDLMTGAYAALLSLAGLHRRKLTGEGGYYDVSMLACTLSASTMVVADAHLNEPEDRRPHNYFPEVAAFEIVEAADGYLVAQSPRSSPDSDCLKSGAHPPGARDLTREELAESLQASGLRATPILTVAETLQHPRCRDQRSLITQLTHPTAGEIEVVGSAFKIRYPDGTTFRAPCDPPPLLGAHTTTISDSGWRSPPGNASVSVSGGTSGPELAAPLGGVRVLELTDSPAAGIAGVLLADLGADVVRAEPHRPGAFDAVWRSAHRGKRSVTLPAEAGERHRLLDLLVRHVDVVVTDGVAGPLSAIHLRGRPDLVIASCTAWGSDGASGPEPVDELVQQAQVGLLHLTGEPDRPPVPVGLPVVSQATAVMTCVGIVSALQVRQRTGLGSRIDMSAYDVMLGMLGYLGQLHLMTGDDPSRVGSRHHHIVPYGVYQSQDGGYVAIAAFTQQMFERFMRAIGRHDLAEDPRFATSAGRKQEREYLEPAVEQFFASRSAAEALSKLEAASIPCSKVLSITEALNSPTIRDSGLIGEWTTDSIRRRFLASPFRVGHQPLYTLRPPALPGEHTREVLNEYLAYDANATSRSRSGVLPSSRDPRL